MTLLIHFKELTLLDFFSLDLSNLSVLAFNVLSYALYFLSLSMNFPFPLRHFQGRFRPLSEAGCKGKNFFLICKTFFNFFLNYPSLQNSIFNLSIRLCGVPCEKDCKDRPFILTLQIYLHFFSYFFVHLLYVWGSIIKRYNEATKQWKNLPKTCLSNFVHTDWSNIIKIHYICLM